MTYRTQPHVLNKVRTGYLYLVPTVQRYTSLRSRQKGLTKRTTSVPAHYRIIETTYTDRLIVFFFTHAKRTRGMNEKKIFFFLGICTPSSLIYFLRYPGLECVSYIYTGDRQSSLLHTRSTCVFRTYRRYVL